MAKRVVPPAKNFGGTGPINKRLRGSQIIYDNRDALAEAIMGIASANITDVMDWQGKQLSIKDVADIPEHALAAIKKIKITPTQQGEIVEVEMVDKVRLYQLLAKSAGLLDQEKNIEKPAVVNIEMVMPEEEEKSEKK